MHICCLNNYLYVRGGAERVMFDEAEMLRQSGHQVSFFSQVHPQNTISVATDEFPIYVDSNALSLSGKLRHAPLMLYNRDTFHRFDRFLGAVRPQLLHAHNIYGGLTTAVLDAAKRHGIPAVMTIHDCKLVCPSYLALDHGRVCDACAGGRFYHCLLARCHKSSATASAIYCAESYFNRWLRKYDHVRYLLCPSRFMREKLIANRFDPQRVLYVPNTVDASRFTPQIGGGDYALYAGRLSHEKGVLTLLHALAALDIPLRILGDGPVRAELEAFVETHGLRNRVFFHGYQTGETLQQLFRQAAFCVLPSEWYENAPMTVLEAFAYGKPVIGADIGGIPEMVEHGKTGMLFPSGDVDALRTALAEMWRQRASLGDMGVFAREVVVTRFSPEQHVEALLGIYRQLVPSRG